MAKSFKKLPLSKLKGIGVYYEDDLYELALLTLKLYDAREAYIGSNTTVRPTVYGLARRFAEMINQTNPDCAPVFAVIEKHKLPLRASIEFDERIKR